MNTQADAVYYPSAGTMRAALIAVCEAEATTPLEKQSQHVLFSLGWALTADDVTELNPEIVADAIVDAVPFPEDEDLVEDEPTTEAVEEQDWLPTDATACSIENGEDCEACQ